MRRFEQKPLRNSVLFLGFITVLFLIIMLIKTRGSVIFSCIYITMLLSVLFISFKNPQAPLHENIFRYRWSLAAILFAVLVVFELSGSSIGNYGVFLNGSVSENTIFGIPRPVRSDEWSVNTPMALSQYKNAFAYFSEIIRGTATDTFIVYGQPVLDISVIFRPFHWGYLFLSEGRGLSFFWMGRLIALFMVTLEFAMFLTNRNRKLSLAAAFLITFAPIVQWWFAVNGLVEMLIFGQLAVLLIDRYMKTDGLALRILFAVIIAVCAGGYVLTFYPAWQIPLFYVFAGASLWVILSNYKKGVFSHRDFLPFIVFLLIFGGGMAYVLKNSYPTIETVMDTAYPGVRVETGGGLFTSIFQYMTNIFLPYKEVNILNSSECAVFFDFFPMGIIMSLIVIFRQKKRDKLLIIFLILSLVFGIYCCVGFPLWLSKITFMNNVQGVRCLLAFGFINILLLIRALSIIEIKLRFRTAALVSAGLTCVTMLFALRKFGDYYNDNLMTVISVLVLMVSFVVILMIDRRGMQKVFCAGCIVLALIMGAAVNPIEKGVGALMDSELISAISDIAEEDDGLWIVEGDSLPAINLPIAAGAPTINSTNVYPCLERWSLLDEEHENLEIYNRYAHICINLTDTQETGFELLQADSVVLTLNIDDFHLLEVEYILTRNELEAFNGENISFELLGNYNGYHIYHVV